MNALREFVVTWQAYRRHHGWLYAAQIAYQCAFRGLPF